MPRGQEKRPEMKSGMLGSEPGFAGRRILAALPAASVATRAAIEQDVAAFARAWFKGDAPAMVRCLHPDFVSRMMGVRAGSAPRSDDPEGVVRSVVGLQGTFGSKIAPDRRGLEVRVLDVRSRSASAVAILGDWVLQVHLARAGGRWSIVNAMWEMV